jgi:hypothetical protein
VVEFYAASFIARATDLVATRFYEQAQTRWRHGWRFVLLFLSQIDPYRYTKSFALPDVERLMRQLDIGQGGDEQADIHSVTSKLLGGTRIVCNDGRFWGTRQDEEPELLRESYYGHRVNVSIAYSVILVRELSDVSQPKGVETLHDWDYLASSPILDQIHDEVAKRVVDLVGFHRLLQGQIHNADRRADLIDI